MLKKLRRKFVAVNMVIVTAMLLVILLMLYNFTKADLKRQCRDTLQMLTQSVQPGGRDKENKNIQLPWFMIRIGFLGDATVSGNTHYDISDEAFLQELAKAVLAGKKPEGVLEDYRLMYSVVPAMGAQYLIFVDTSVQEAALRSQLNMSLMIGVASLVAFLGISILLARSAISPVEKAWEQQKRFVSDASHELKTPLTVIMSNAELLQGRDCEEPQQYADNILIMARQMRYLVEGMLELSRAENGQIRKAFAQLSLSKLINDALLPFEPLLFEKDLLLEAKVEEGITVNGSEQYLQQLVDILLDNAGKYSAPGIINVELHRTGRNQCMLTVANPGDPIPAEELEKIFDRFYRTDTARSRTGSFGLGLPIARAIARGHGGKIWAESNATGNRFCVQLPCNP